MPSQDLPVDPKTAFDVTDISTLWLVTGVGLTCTVLWAVIATTIGA